MNARLLFLKYLTIKRRMLARPNAVVTKHPGKRSSAWFKSMTNVQGEAKAMMLENNLTESDLSLLKEIVSL